MARLHALQLATMWAGSSPVTALPLVWWPTSPTPVHVCGAALERTHHDTGRSSCALQP